MTKYKKYKKNSLWKMAKKSSKQKKKVYDQPEDDDIAVSVDVENLEEDEIDQCKSN
jgi:hypothetical protein